MIKLYKYKEEKKFYLICWGLIDYGKLPKGLRLSCKYVIGL